MTAILGIDIGGTGIKVARVDVERGVLISERRRLPTPQPASPEAVVAAAARLAGSWDGPVGVGFPGVVRRGRIATAANLDDSWIGTDAADLISQKFGGARVGVVNDADAAGLAEVRFGAGAAVPGVVMMVTLGTGIGTALFNDGVLFPNAELGHLALRGTEAEKIASGKVKTDENLSWEHWTEHLLEVLREFERLLWPDLFIIGGGISKKFRRYCEGLQVRTRVLPAALGNDAGIVGAALSAAAPAST